MENCSRITDFERRGEALLVRCGEAALTLCFYSDEILRVRVSFDGAFPAESSYVLSALPILPLQAEETEESLILRSAALRLELQREPFCLRLFDADGDELYASLPGLTFTRDYNRRITHYSRIEEDDRFYGFGEKGGALNKNGMFIRERATDAMGYDPDTADTLYKHIPFYIRLGRRTKKAVGLFYHNFHESVFNLGREKSNYRPRYSYWQADGGEIDLFLLGGGTLRRIVGNYTLLTGRPALLPKRAYGYQASSMYYPELEKDCDRAVLDFIGTLKREGFPVDGFHLSSGYTAQEGKRCVFTWSRERFPDPVAYLAAMDALGAPNVPNVKPGVLTAHPRYAAWAAQGVFVRDAEKDTPALGPWWGGEGALWDFTKPEARRLWKDCLKESLVSLGVRSVWNDNCEYDSLADGDCRVDCEGKGERLAALKPVMSNLMCALAAEAVAEVDPDARPYIVCRSGAAGIQRWAQTWCGDNRSDWASLRASIPILCGMGLSGQPNEGADVGGFAGPAPAPELFLRWVQLGALQPRFSIHSANSDNTVTEPWMYPSLTPLVRDAMHLRYRLTPYLYSLAYEAAQSGAPIMRALVYEFQDDPAVWDESGEFLLGRDLLAAPVLEEGARTRRVTLPDGCAWYDWNDGFRRYAGGQTVDVPVELASIPLFLREGAILPLADNPIDSMERDRVTDLRLLLIPGAGERRFVLYDDDGVSNAYRRGEYRKTEIVMRGVGAVTVDFRSEGSFSDPVERVLLELVCPGGAPLSVALGEDELPRCLDRARFETAELGWYYDMETRAALIRYPNPRRDMRVSVGLDAFDLIGM